MFVCCVPVCLSRSDAILKYLATKYDVPEHWYPRQPERRARVDEYTAWHHSNTRPHAAKVFITEVYLYTHLNAPARSRPISEGGVCDVTVRSVMGLCLRPAQVLLPAQSGSSVDEVRLIHALSQLDDTLDKLESMFLRRQPFLCGDDVTVADLLAVCELMQVRGSDWSRLLIS